MIFDQLRTVLEVNLKPGVYVFDNCSGIGKTRLCELLREYNSYGLNVDGYSYYDFRNGRHLPKGLSVLLLDRYDMYNGELVDEIEAIRNQTVVLIDLKCEDCNIPYVQSCEFEWNTYNLIRVLP